MKRAIMAVLAAASLSLVVFAPAVAAELSEKPLLLVRFNQEHVYYARALKQAVVNAENAKPGVRYHVVSSVPSARHKGQPVVSAAQAKKNMDELVGALGQLGVDAARISTASKMAPVNSQQIAVYVQ
jgi:hypothetical protein